MTRLYMAIAFLCAMLVVPASATSPEVLNQWNGDQIDWLSFEEGVEIARKTGRPVLVVFHTTWCPHCSRYSKQFFDSKVVALSHGLVMVLVDRDESPHVNSRYDRFGGYIPRTMVLSPAAEHMEEIRGEDPEYRYFLDTSKPDELIGVMTKALAR